MRDMLSSIPRSAPAILYFWARCIEYSFLKNLIYLTAWFLSLQMSRICTWFDMIVWTSIITPVFHPASAR